MSGGSEEESEKVMLLDELIALIDERTARIPAAKTTEGLKRQREEEALLAARRLTMDTRAESSPHQKRRGEVELKGLLIRRKEKEIADKKAEREELALQRAREHEEDKIEASRQ
ncbi:hypothetical protein GN244_ATG17725 [Phytophthora infestans]|uniref:Uncharacterized protein n=1 Tax=Phytophthora infestans TaxID=4787 RepID=A0A833SGN8_PHYIN|nr:hypothetical protein GN244_ATG17725 [Phytophthora infestans]